MRTKLVAGAALLALAAPVGAAGVPARDRFSGKVRPGTGAYKHASGRTKMVFRLSKDHKRYTLRLTGLRCQAAGCLSLTGKLSGRAIPPKPPILPDVGCSYRLPGSGKLSRLGTVRVTGWAHGTGFEAEGRETIDLTLHNKRGTVRIHAVSPVVKGFTCPG